MWLFIGEAKTGSEARLGITQIQLAKCFADVPDCVAFERDLDI
jgi:uncharacterized protein (DUF1499 family)